MVEIKDIRSVNNQLLLENIDLKKENSMKNGEIINMRTKIIEDTEAVHLTNKVTGTSFSNTLDSKFNENVSHVAHCDIIMGSSVNSLGEDGTLLARNALPKVISPNDNSRSYSSVLKGNKDVRKNNSGILGQGKIDSIKVVKHQKRRNLFVSRFFPETTVAQIQELLYNNDYTDISVSKLIAKFPHLYSSFLVQCNVEDFEKIVSSLIWPEGCFIRSYYANRSMNNRVIIYSNVLSRDLEVLE